MNTRKMVISFAVLAVIGIAVVVWIGGSLNSIVKAGVQKYGPRITETNVQLASVKLEVRDGRGTLRGLRIANPEGFSRADAVSLGEITMDLDVATLGKEPIVIETIRVAGPELLLEISKDGKTNLGAIQSAAERYAPPRAGGIDGSLKSTDKPMPRIVVKKFEFTGGTLRLDPTAIGGEKSERELGSFTLTNLGGTNAGLPADQLGREMLRAMVRKAIEKGTAGELERLAKDKLGEVGGRLRSLTD